MCLELMLLSPNELEFRVIFKIPSVDASISESSDMMGQRQSPHLKRSIEFNFPFFSLGTL